MARLHFPTKEPMIDVKTGMLTDPWRTFLDQLNESLAALDFSNIGGVLSLSQLPLHQTTHNAGGTDAIKLDELAEARDLTLLDSNTLRHGLLPKLSGNAAHTLKGDGTWS
jgi:hypothetical protein